MNIGNTHDRHLLEREVKIQGAYCPRNVAPNMTLKANHLPALIKVSTHGFSLSGFRTNILGIGMALGRMRAGARQPCASDRGDGPQFTELSKIPTGSATC